MAASVPFEFRHTFQPNPKTPGLCFCGEPESHCSHHRHEPPVTTLTPDLVDALAKAAGLPSRPYADPVVMFQVKSMEKLLQWEPERVFRYFCGLVMMLRAIND